MKHTRTRTQRPSHLNPSPKNTPTTQGHLPAAHPPTHFITFKKRATRAQERSDELMLFVCPTRKHPIFFLFRFSREFPDFFRSWTGSCLFFSPVPHQKYIHYSSVATGPKSVRSTIIACSSCVPSDSLIQFVYLVYTRCSVLYYARTVQGPVDSPSPRSRSRPVECMHSRPPSFL
jgi:hypothetical protein